jgi:predicted anti-sigma-YlaC factor YlaD
MNCELHREELVAYGYGELGPSESAAVEAHLATCPDCRQALEELSRTRRLLRAWAEEEPPFRLTFVGQQVPGRWRLPDWLTGRRGWGLALGLGALVLVLVAGVEVRYREGELGLRVGLGRADSTAVVERPLARGELLQAQQYTLETVAEMLRQAEERRQGELGLLLTGFARELERQRRQDLEWVGRRLQEMDWYTQARFRRSEQALQQLLPAQYEGQW